MIACTILWFVHLNIKSYLLDYCNASDTNTVPWACFQWFQLNFGWLMGAALFVQGSTHKASLALHLPRCWSPRGKILQVSLPFWTCQRKHGEKVEVEGCKTKPAKSAGVQSSSQEGATWKKVVWRLDMRDRQKNCDRLYVFSITFWNVCRGKGSAELSGIAGALM